MLEATPGGNAGSGRFDRGAGAAPGGRLVYHRIATRQGDAHLPSVMKRASRAAIAAGLIAGLLACTHAPPRTEAQKEADKALAERVDGELQADKLIYARHITVKADRGVVHLSGYVWETPELYEAQRVAASVPGVASVVNDLELQRNGIGNSPVSR